MGAHSTVYITRSRAKQELIERINNADDKTLEELMDKFLDHRLLNCLIVSDDTKIDSDREYWS